jgi:hypothetical protein
MFITRPEYDEAINMWRNYEQLKNRWDMKSELIGSQVKVLMGHFPMRLYDGLFPSAFRMIWLRNPIDRVISVYHHYITKGGLVGDHTKPRKHMSKHMSLVEFANLPQQQNVMSHFYKSEQAFDYIGFLETYQDCLAELSLLLGWDKPPPRYLNKGVYAPVSTGIRDYIASLNEKDMELYRSFSYDKS